MRNAMQSTASERTNAPALYIKEFAMRFSIYAYDRYADGATIAMPQHEFGLTK